MTRRLLVPLSCGLLIRFDANAVQLEPAHCQDRFLHAFLRGKSIQPEGLGFICVQYLEGFVIG